MYVHTLDGRAPDASIYYHTNDSVGGAQADNTSVYYEGISFRGNTIYLRNSSAAGGMKAYLYNCTGSDWIIAGVDECIFQSCGARGGTDGFNYDVRNGKITNAIEIDCENYGGGSTSSDQASTSHNGCKVVRINGKYHDFAGQCCAEAQTTTRAWILGSELYNSSVANVGYYTEGQAWLDCCTIHDVTTDLAATGVSSVINKRNLISGGVFIGSGTAQDY